MSTFFSFISNIRNSFNLKYLKDIKEKQSEILNIITQQKMLQVEILQCIETLDCQYDTLVKQSNTIIELLEKENKLHKQLNDNLLKKDKNLQNLWAKKHGVKSAIQYQLKLTAKSSQNNIRIKEQQSKLEEYEIQRNNNQVERNQKLLELEKIEKNIEAKKQELEKVNNAIKYYSYNRFLVSFSSLSVLMLCSCFIFSQINQLNNIFKITICSISISIIAILSICLFLNEKRIREILELKKCNYFSFIFPLMIGLCVYFTLFNNYSLRWISTIFLICTTIFILFNIYYIVKAAEKENSFNLQVDYLIFNLPIVNFLVIYIIYLTKFEQLFNYISAGCLILIFIMYVLGFCWIFKIKRFKDKVTFKYCLGVILNILVCFAILSLIIINFATTINISENFFSWLNLIFVIIGAFAGPILNNLFKTNIKDPLDENKEE
ncbi:MAG: hypothetical protein ACI4R8_00830 [Candidatus Caccovivens sp.]